MKIKKKMRSKEKSFLRDCASLLFFQPTTNRAYLIGGCETSMMRTS